MSTIFLTAPNTHDNIANIVMKSSWEAVKTLQLNSHETSSNNKIRTFRDWKALKTGISGLFVFVFPAYDETSWKGMVMLSQKTNEFQIIIKP